MRPYVTCGVAGVAFPALLVGLLAQCGQAQKVAESLLDPRFAGTTMARGAAPETGARETETFGVRLADGGTGVLRVGERVTVAESLPIEGADGGVYLEAEDAEQIDALPAAESPSVKQDEGAGGGAYVDNPGFLSIPFRLATAGKRDLWARVREGTDDENRTLWTVDRGRIWLVSEKAEGKQGTWRWIKVGSRDLSAGDHRFLNHHYYKEDFHFDRIAILPAGASAPEGLGPRQPRAEPDVGVVETRDVAPPAMDGLVRISAKRELNGGTIDYEVSLDGGTSWVKAPGGDLTGAPINGDGQDSVRFRLTLRRSADGHSPLIRAVEVTVRPKPDAWLALRNDYVRVLFDGTTGRLFRMTDLERDRELAWVAQPASLFEVDLKKRGESGWLRYSDEKTYWVELDPERRTDKTEEVERAEGLPPDRAEAVGGARAAPAAYVGGVEDDGTVTLTYAVEGSVRLALSVSLNDSGQTLWRADVENGHPELDVIRLKFPMFARLRLGETGMDDHQLRCQTFGHHRIRPGLAAIRDAKYPGGVALPWESIYDDSGGFGIIARDPQCLNVGFESKANAGGYFRDTLDLGVRKYHNIEAGGGRATWEYAVGVHPGRWHWISDRYREWAVQHFERPRYPAWFAESDGFYNRGIQNGGLPFAELGTLAEGALRNGLIHCQIWGQFTGKGGGCCGPYWMPSPLYGTLDDFKGGIADIHAAGCKVGFFHLHDRLDLYHAQGSHVYGRIPKTAYPPGTEFPSHEFFVKHHWVGSPDGSAVYPLTDEQWAEYREKIAAYEADPAANKPPMKWHPVDISAPEWWEYMRHWAIDKYVEEWGADGHYFDVLGCGTARESYDLRKGHHGHSMSAPGKMGIPRTTVESARERGHEEYFLLMEGMCDVPGQWTAGMISGLYYNHSETVRYTWPDFVLFEGHSNSGHLTPIKSLEAAYLNGNRFDIVHSNKVMAGIIEARARVRDWIYRGRFMDTLGLDSPAPARLFIRRDAGAVGAAVTFVNRDGAEGTVRLDTRRAGDVARAIGVNEQGDTFSVPLARDGDYVTFPAPTAHFATVILAEDVDLEHGLIAGVGLERGEGGSQIRVTIANLSGDAVAGTISAREFAPFRPPGGGVPFTCDAGGVVAVELPVEETPEFWRFARLAFDVRVGERTVATTEASVFPLMRDPSFEYTGNDENQVVGGRKSLRLDPSDELYHRIYPLNFEPDRRYRLSLAYKRTAGEAQLSGARIWQRLGRQNEVNVGALNFPTEGRWDRVETVFDSASSFVATDLYLYNWKSKRTTWVDDVRIEDFGPVPAD